MRRVIIKNVLVETGFIHDMHEEIIATQTELKELYIEDGVFVTSFSASTDEAVTVDAKGALIVPSFREMHIHLDKTYFSGEWQAVRPAKKGILTRIEEEQQLLPKLLPVAQHRAEQMIQHLLRHGHTHIRTHVNVDPMIGTKHIEMMLETLAKYKHQLSYEIVAFPQHGLLRSQVQPLMKEALKMGADLVGGVDPATMDRNINHSIDTMVELAVQFNKGIDLHLHDGGSLGAYEIDVLAEKVLEAKFNKSVTVSHALALGDLQDAALKQILIKMRASNMDVTTSVPIGRPTIPVHSLYEAGIPVSTGHDSLTDHWSPFGTGDTVQKLSRLAERFHFATEQQLHQTLRYATGGITPLNVEGNQLWPKAGAQADALLVRASCTAEMIARRSPVEAVLSKGRRL